MDQSENFGFITSKTFRWPIARPTARSKPTSGGTPEVTLHFSTTVHLRQNREKSFALSKIKALDIFENAKNYTEGLGG